MATFRLIVFSPWAKEGIAQRIASDTINKDLKKRFIRKYNIL